MDLLWYHLIVFLSTKCLHDLGNKKNILLKRINVACLSMTLMCNSDQQQKSIDRECLTEH